MHHDLFERLSLKIWYFGIFRRDQFDREFRFGFEQETRRRGERSE